MVELVKINKQYIVDRINDLNQSPDVKEWLYLQRVLKTQEKEDEVKPEETKVE